MNREGDSSSEPVISLVFLFINNPETRFIQRLNTVTFFKCGPG